MAASLAAAAQLAAASPVLAGALAAPADGPDLDPATAISAASPAPAAAGAAAAMESPAGLGSAPSQDPAAATPPALAPPSAAMVLPGPADPAPLPPGQAAAGDPAAPAKASAFPLPPAPALPLLASLTAAAAQPLVPAKPGAASPVRTSVPDLPSAAPAPAGRESAQAAGREAQTGSQGQAVPSTGNPGAAAPDPVAAGMARTAAAGLTQTQAKAALELAVPGAKLQVKAGPEAAAPAKAALTELLGQPRNPVESPTILNGQNSLELQGSPTGRAQTAADLASQTGSAPGSGTATLPGAGPDPGAAQAAAVLAAPAAQAAAKATAAAAAPDSTPAPTHPSLVAQMDGSIRWLLKNQDQGADLQLHPESLGTLQIRLRMDGNEVHAKVWASDPAALPVLQDHRAFLEASLKQQGLNLSSFDLQQGRQGEQAQLPSQAPTVPVPVGTATAQAGQESPGGATPASSDPHRIELIA